MKRMRLTAVAAGLAAAGLVTGCMSAYRMSSTLEPSGQPVPQAGAARFRIASVLFVNPTNVPSSEFPSFGDLQLESSYDYTQREQAMPDGGVATVMTPVRHYRHRDVLAAAAAEQYPQVFSSDAGAIPLDVTITRVAATNELPGNPCLSCLTLTVLPFRQQYQTDYAVHVQTANADVNKVLDRPVTFSRISSSSSSCLVPAGLLPVAGEGGARRTGDEARVYCGELTLDACVEAVVQSIRRVEPGMWEKARAAK